MTHTKAAFRVAVEDTARQEADRLVGDGIVADEDGLGGDLMMADWRMGGV